MHRSWADKLPRIPRKCKRILEERVWAATRRKALLTGKRSEPFHEADAEAAASISNHPLQLLDALDDVFAVHRLVRLGQEVAACAFEHRGQRLQLHL